MNLASLTTLLVMLSGVVAPWVQMTTKGASGWSFLLCAVASLLYGAAAGLVASLVSHWLLNTSVKNDRFAAIATGAYLLFPLPAMTLAALGAYLWSSALLR